MTNRTPEPELAAAAYHEAGHCIAIWQAFRTATWLPYPRPMQPVRYVEINADGTGNCFGLKLYSVKWACIAPRYKPMMVAQIGVEIAGGVAESLHRCGIRHGRELWSFAESCCAVDGDLERIAAVLGDLRRLTGYRYRPEEFAEPTATMLLEHWPAVSALARALVAERRIEGDEVEAIIDRSLYRRASAAF